MEKRIITAIWNDRLAMTNQAETDRQDKAEDFIHRMLVNNADLIVIQKVPK